MAALAQVSWIEVLAVFSLARLVTAIPRMQEELNALRELRAHAGFG